MEKKDPHLVLMYCTSVYTYAELLSLLKDIHQVIIALALFGAQSNAPVILIFLDEKNK